MLLIRVKRIDFKEINQLKPESASIKKAATIFILTVCFTPLSLLNWQNTVVKN
jgi:hypothetical protein